MEPETLISGFQEGGTSSELRDRDEVRAAWALPVGADGARGAAPRLVEVGHDTVDEGLLVTAVADAGQPILHRRECLTS
jgi:hypothetical protein